jgi:PiT family inorganic phosphate transporter
VFGVGFLREFLDNNEKRFLQETRKRFKRHKRELDLMQEELNRLEIIKDKSKTHYVKIVELYKKIDDKENLVKQEIKDVKDAKSTKYVKRDAIKKIIAAWIITVPAAAILSAAIFFMIKGFMASI